MPDENHITPSILRSGMALADMAVASTVDAVELRKRIAELEAVLRGVIAICDDEEGQPPDALLDTIRHMASVAIKLEQAETYTGADGKQHPIAKL